MKIGAIDNGWWHDACGALGHESVLLPAPSHPSGSAHAADIAARRESGTAMLDILRAHPVDLILDNGGAGLAFTCGPGGAADLRLVHETVGKPLCSHFIDPITVAAAGLPWEVVWSCMQSTSWVKAVWDRAQVVELQQLQVPGVVHLPMAAPVRTYDDSPVDPSTVAPTVSFVGAQNSTYFTGNAAVPSSSLFAGTLAQAVRGDLPGVSFFDVYHNLYGLGEPITQADDPATRARKARTYFEAKLFFNASLMVRNRDRFVIFLKRELGESFRLIGSGWDKSYGLPALPALPTYDEYLDHFRKTAVNINLVSGNAETGLNMRHYEITAAGGFMLCYDQPELAELFDVGTECEVFHDERELLEKTRYYLAHPEKRAEIAAAGQRRTLSQHLYSHRLEQLLATAGVGPPPVEFATTTWSEDVAALLPEADVVLDCGANVGQMARAFRKQFPQAEIHSFEPVAALQDDLRAACAKIDVAVVQKAVGDRDGTAEINLTTSPEANSLLDFQPGNPCAKWTQVVGREQIEVCTLDRWCKESGVATSRVDFIKLDVQGAELQALYGARSLLKTVRLIMLEVSFVKIYKDCPLFDEVDRFLKESGYQLHAVYPSDQPRNWGDALYVKEGTTV